MIVIEEITSRVVGWIYIDQVNFAKICLLKELQSDQVFALDENVSCGCKVGALISERAKRIRDRFVCLQNRLFLARPVQQVMLLRPLDDGAGEFLAQLVEVDGLGDAALLVPRFGDAVGEELGQ